MVTIGIIGLGLIGGSIAKSIKSSGGFEYDIVAFNRSELPLIEAYNEGVISKYSTTDMSIFMPCDIIFICTPVDRITAYVERLLPYIKKDCILTDCGSTKNHIYEKMLAFGDKINFIGGHPMAGSEKTGYLSATDYLLENAYYILTPTPYVDDKHLETIVSLVKLMRAIPVVISASYHDYVVSAISHVPHVIAATLVNMVNQLDDDNKYMHTLAAGGFKDITRIASSSPEVWSSICNENKTEILKVIKHFKSILEDFETQLENDNFKDIYNFFETSRDYRNTFANKKSSIIQAYSLNVDVLDRPGSIATISTMLSVNNINIKNIGIINNREFTGGILQIVVETQADKDKSSKLLTDMGYKVYNK